MPNVTAAHGIGSAARQDGTSVKALGQLDEPPGFRRGYGEARANTLLDWNNSALWCNRTRTQSIDLDADVVGGATVVVVGMADENAGSYLACQVKT
ncbi:hypothetical protein [Saccharothrix texasensis]|uniref:Uncharacterized protein n=1 Tax=Saccharothrix texasensis TaxID=103734 RepID=A0A3N1HIX9_9PSEU|nr:hypothetical protein [Saccharothrix texasensis]ROP42449.1 hypothetical protein EDD40_7951 [Saccharothrix texasensis]